MHTLILRIAAALAWAVLLVPGTAPAEPYLAVAKGMQCSACHSHPGGGGKRSTYGNVYSQSELPVARLGNTDADFWTGELSKWFAVGGNLRGGFNYADTPGIDEVSEFSVNRATIYLEANLIPNRLTVYIDQQVAPSASINREAYIRTNSANGKWSLTAGQFFLPYGLRLQDDSAFVRLATGVNFDNPDRGLQLGYESGPWSIIGSITNGSGGGREIDSGKQFSFVGSYVQSRWRFGVSASANEADGGDREMAGVFAGLRTGPIAWLAEIDQVRDDVSPGVTRDALVGLVEGNWMFRRGHNLKISYDALDPDDEAAGDREIRYSLVWEYTPMQFLQGRIGFRTYDGPDGNGFLNRDTAFAELHGFF